MRDLGEREQGKIIELGRQLFIYFPSVSNRCHKPRETITFRGPLVSILVPKLLFGLVDWVGNPEGEGRREDNRAE